jgi:hypothetical protein
LTPDRRPLHPQWENMNAEVPLAQLECREPMPSIEIQDSEHHVLRTIPLGGDCLGHGGGPFAMEKGKAARTFRELTTASPQAPVGLTPISPDLPGPGVYFLVSVWPPHVLDPLDPASPEWLRRTCRPFRKPLRKHAITASAHRNWACQRRAIAVAVESPSTRKLRHFW